MLLAGCPGKKRCEKRGEDAADTELAKSNRTHLFFSTSGLLLGSRAPLVFVVQIRGCLKKFFGGR